MRSALLPSRKLLLGLCVVAALAWPLTAGALCSSVAEEGRWRNLATPGDPAFIDVRMTDCGDQVLNGVQTTIRYRLQVWVRQSSGQFFGRPPVAADYRAWNGKRWLVGRVPTGGYVDNVWMLAVDQNGQRRLHVLIKHESLDSKPSTQSEHWFQFDKRL